jgi:hypothetical protein
MLKQAELFRDRIVIPEARRMLKQMELHTSCGFPNETDVINTLAGRGERDMELGLVKFLMEQFGHPHSHVQDPRFDKTRRALAKATPKGPRGEPRKRQPAVNCESQVGVQE